MVFAGHYPGNHGIIFSSVLAAQSLGGQSAHYDSGLLFFHGAGATFSFGHNQQKNLLALRRGPTFDLADCLGDGEVELKAKFQIQISNVKQSPKL